MATVRTIGIYWICDDCIQSEEKRLGKIAVFFYRGGIDFLTQEEFNALPKENNAAYLP